MHTQIAPAAFEKSDDDATDDFVGASIMIDYERDLAMTEPDQPDGRIVFDSDDYETDEEADAALEAFFDQIIEGRYEKNI
jgi:hypothetical protein